MFSLVNRCCLTYSYNDFFIDIVTDLDNQDYFAWLYHKDIGIKDFIIGVSMEQNTFSEFLNLVESEIDDDIVIYLDNFDR